VYEVLTVWQPKLFDPSFKGGLQMRAENLVSYAQFTDGRLIERALKERFWIDMRGLMIPRNHKLFTVIDRKIQQHIEGGLIDFYNAEWIELLKPNYKEYAIRKEPRGPKVLTLKHLEAGFVVWLVSICVASVIFVFEMIYKQI
jgi:hypothetical protein